MTEETRIILAAADELEARGETATAQYARALARFGDYVPRTAAKCLTPDEGSTDA